MASSSSPSQSPPSVGSCKEHTPLVEDQKSEGHCVAIVMADMASTTIRMLTGASIELMNLSPGPIVDAGLLKENHHVAAFADENRGLELSRTYLYWHLERSHKSWSNEDYVARPRFYLKEINNVTRKKLIKKKLREHFLGDGLKLPFVGDLYTGDLNNREKAKERAETGGIYRHPVKEWYTKTVDHSVLIVGIDVSDEDPANHYVEVKCTWGEKYGDKGFTKVDFDIFKKIWYPAQGADGLWYGTNCKEWPDMLAQSLAPNCREV